jgi:hypothetical protein
MLLELLRTSETDGEITRLITGDPAIKRRTLADPSRAALEIP